MFDVGEYIIYGANGVCRVEEIGTMNLSGVSKDRLYYTLLPVGEKDGKIYTPVDNSKTPMRPVLTKQEAGALIGEINNLDEIWVKDEKKREQTYRDAMRTCDSKEWVRIIKTLYLRKKSRIAEGKKVTTSDERYLKMAEDNLYGELSIALEIPKDKMGEYISEHM